MLVCGKGKVTDVIPSMYVQMCHSWLHRIASLGLWLLLLLEVVSKCRWGLFEG
jgi:hypothetical protein